MDDHSAYVSTDIVPNQFLSGNVSLVTKQMNNKLSKKQTLGFTHSLKYPICGPIFMDYHNVNLYSIPFSYANVLQRQLGFPTSWPFQGLLMVQCMDEYPDYGSTDIVPNEF